MRMCVCVTPYVCVSVCVCERACLPCGHLRPRPPAPPPPPAPSWIQSLPLNADFPPLPPSLFGTLTSSCPAKTGQACGSIPMRKRSERVRRVRWGRDGCEGPERPGREGELGGEENKGATECMKGREAAVQLREKDKRAAKCQGYLIH